ncbi:NAD(P)-binding domain-containing protein [Dioscorea alata]|uniref:NAD(P)-binding domain-containing protein n=1 Tax=Dioscorea alata TaxID=55571 RepID=A0ACB7V6S4_DIOAL|nr:NAD(P)-binding domain-containing protein [Dioscorea alata]
MANVFFITIQAWCLNYGCELIVKTKSSFSSFFVFLLFNLVITLIYLLSYRRQPCFYDEQHHQVCKQDFNDIYIECTDDLQGEKEKEEADDDDDDDDGMDADELRKRADELISYRRQPCFYDEQHHQVGKQDFNDIYIECIDDLQGEKELVVDDDGGDDDDGMDADELRKRADEFIKATIKGWIEEKLREGPEC